MAMDLFLSPLGIAINLLSREAVSHCFFLMRSATKPPLAARKPPSNARAARCRFPTARSIEVAGKGLRRVGHLVVGRVPVRVVRHREARFPGSSEPLTVTPYQHLPPRTRNCYLCQLTKNLHPVGRRGSDRVPVLNSQLLYFGEKSCGPHDPFGSFCLTQMVHPSMQRVYLRVPASKGVGGTRHEYAFGASDDWHV
jgi:hypothetical protein